MVRRTAARLCTTYSAKQMHSEECSDHPVGANEIPLSIGNQENQDSSSETDETQKFSSDGNIKQFLDRKAQERGIDREVSSIEGKERKDGEITSELAQNLENITVRKEVEGHKRVRSKSKSSRTNERLSERTSEKNNPKLYIISRQFASKLYSNVYRSLSVHADKIVGAGQGEKGGEGGLTHKLAPLVAVVPPPTVQAPHVHTHVHTRGPTQASQWRQPSSLQPAQPVTPKPSTQVLLQ